MRKKDGSLSMSYNKFFYRVCQLTLHIKSSLYYIHFYPSLSVRDSWFEHNYWNIKHPCSVLIETVSVFCCVFFEWSNKLLLVIHCISCFLCVYASNYGCSFHYAFNFKPFILIWHNLFSNYWENVGETYANSLHETYLWTKKLCIRRVCQFS